MKTMKNFTLNMTETQDNLNFLFCAMLLHLQLSWQIIITSIVYLFEPYRSKNEDYKKVI